jgi:hypothetical protein
LLRDGDLVLGPNASGRHGCTSYFLTVRICYQV